jgi:hypothetical protein
MVIDQERPGWRSLDRLKTNGPDLTMLVIQNQRDLRLVFNC